MTVQGRKDRVPGPAEVWGLVRAETKAAVAADKADGPNGVAPAARAAVVGKDRATAPDVEETSKANSRTF